MSKTIEELRADAQRIKNETGEGRNTATRVGGLFEDIVDMIDDYHGDGSRPTPEPDEGNAVLYEPQNASDYEKVAALNNLHGKAYNAAKKSGLGKVYLDKNNGLLTQAMMNAANTCYVIMYDYDLGGETITVPEGCVLEFDGGSLKNGTIDLNGSKIEAGHYQIFGDGLDIVTEHKREVYSSWFGMNNEEDCASKVEKALNTLKDCGVLHLDCDVKIERPVTAEGLLYTKIDSSVSSNDLNIQLKTYGFYGEYSAASNESLFNIKAEGLHIKNVYFRWRRKDGVAASDLDSAVLNLDTPYANAADLDCVIEGCTIDFMVGLLIRAKGRGVYIERCLLNHPDVATFTNVALIEIIGKDSGQYNSEAFMAPKDCMRGISIKDNRIHNALNDVFVRFVQDPDNPETTIVNAVISGNISDLGCGGIVSTSKHRGLLITNNVFTIRTYRRIAFNTFVNSINGLIFSNNSITCLESDPDYANRKTDAETVFQYASGGVSFENIIFSNNIYDAKMINTLVAFRKEDSTDVVETLPTVKNFELVNNLFSSRAFTENTDGIYKSLVVFVNCGYDGVNVVGNTVPSSANAYGLSHAYTANHKGSYCVQKRAFVFCNTGLKYDVDYFKSFKTSKHDISDTVTTNNIIPLVTTIRNRADVGVGTRVYDMTLRRFLEWTPNGMWIGGDGFTAAPKSGLLADRPTLPLLPSDTGFTYFATDVEKPIHFSCSVGNEIYRETITPSNGDVRINASLTTGDEVMFNCPDVKWHTIYFAKNSSPADADKLVVQDSQEVQVNFVVPDLTEYPYLFVGAEEAIVISIVTLNKKWVYSDGTAVQD